MTSIGDDLAAVISGARDALSRLRVTRANLILAAREFFRHRLVDWSATLGFYAGLSLVPALVIIVGCVGLLGDGATETLTDNIMERPSGPLRSLALEAVDQVSTGLGAGVTLLAGVIGAIWSASAYVGGFIRATGVINRRTANYPYWKLRPLQIAVTLGVILALAAAAIVVIVTGPIAENVAASLGLEGVVAQVWDIAKWPVLVLLVGTVFAALYWVGPDTRTHGFRWLTAGGLVATTVWALGSGAYALYVSTVPSHNALYGSLGLLIGFLAWIWISNMALLYGAVLNTIVDRGRAEGAERT
jgi:membrane protein